MASQSTDAGCGNASCMYSASGAYVCAPPTAAQKQEGREQFVDATAAATGGLPVPATERQGRGLEAPGSFSTEGFYSPSAPTPKTPACSTFPEAIQAAIRSKGKCT